MTTKITLQEKMNAVVKTLPDVHGYKMGYKNILIVGDLTAIDDAREYYSGRGAKYNSSVKHGGATTIMTEREFKKAYKPVAARLKELKQRAIAEKKYLANCNTPAFIRTEVEKVVEFVSDEYVNDSEGRYWLNVYHGCGVYRLIIKDGKIVASIKGGFHQSLPFGVKTDLWIDAIYSFIKEKFGNIADFETGGIGYYSNDAQVHIVKADGSGCQFFLRDSEDAHLLAVKQYNVPAPNGDGNLRYAHHNIQIV